MSDRLRPAALLPLLLGAASAGAGAEVERPVVALERVLGAEPPLALAPLKASEVGPWRIVRELGSGGMGTVYLAEASAEAPATPRRRVALKLPREGRVTPELMARFEEERQALAALDHDFVVRLFAAGTSADGRPWLALEHVDGEPITRFCERRALDVETRLRLFVDVCEAVQHVHERGLLHGDLKPANILVRERAGRFVPKLIDLGLARRIGAGQEGEPVMGTPAYMAPELFALGPVELDARADVYALGLVLRELLIGTRPPEGGVLELVRRTLFERRPGLEEELAALGREAAPLARRRQTRPGRLARRLRGTLDALVQRSCAARREERPVSAAALARELQRDLARHASRRRTCARLALAATAALAGFLGGWLVAG